MRRSELGLGLQLGIVIGDGGSGCTRGSLKVHEQHNPAGERMVL